MPFNCASNRAKLLGLIVLMWAAYANAAPPAAERADSSRLFNGRNFDGWYVFTTETGNENPGVFQVVDGMIYVPGGKGEQAYYGGLITNSDLENYRLRLEYKWGTSTYGDRKGKARDAGVLLHCIGPNEPGPWMTSYEFQIMEGGTGDLVLLNPTVPGGSDPKVPGSFPLSAKAEVDIRDGYLYFKPGSPLRDLKRGDRLNWYGRPLDWKDEFGVRGKADLESPIGEWTHCEIVARKNSLEYYVNGKLVNRASDLNVSRGKILLQTEGAEVWYRNIELTQLAE